MYFTVFSALCVLGEAFLVWYEIYRRDSGADYLDIIMNILLDTGPVAMAAAILAFIILKGRDAMLSTWETFAQRRVERGIEIGEKRERERWRAERKALAKQLQEERKAREILEKQIEEGKEEGREEQECASRSVLRNLRSRSRTLGIPTALLGAERLGNPENGARSGNDDNRIWRTEKGNGHRA